MIKAIHVKELREKTGAGMMDCKKALMENNGDFEQAVDWIRKKGLSIAAKKSGRITAEGAVAIYTKDNFASLIEVNAETDFVAKNEQFQNLVRFISSSSYNVSDIDILQNKTDSSGKKISDIVSDAIANIGENITLRRLESVTIENGVIGSYVHNEVTKDIGKIGVIVALESSSCAESTSVLAKQIAMHIAAMRPIAINVSDIDQATLDKERMIATEQSSKSNKPQNVIEKMVEGRMRKFHEEVVLMEQIFAIDGKTKIKDIIENESKKLGTKITLSKFIRFEVGEGIEVEKTDFASDVASMISN